MSERLNEILGACKQGNSHAQKQLYDLTKGKMFAVCLRYTRSRSDAEDVLQEGYMKVFRDLYQYTGEGVFEGWMRKVIVNTALQFLRKQNRKPSEVNLEDHAFYIEYQNDFEDDSVNKNRTEELIKLMRSMPDGFRTVLNLYILEGYSHQEISEICGISIGTSKSQLNRAKAFLRKQLEKTLLNKRK